MTPIITAPIITAEVRARHRRSLVKAVTWRVIGTTDTFLWGWLVTGHPMQAGAIAGTETFTKIFLFYLHERAWQHVGGNRDGHLRSVIKAFSWRFVGSLDTFLLSWLITGKAHYAVTIAGGEALTKIVLYYIHERVWNRITWGRKDKEADVENPAEAIENAGQPSTEPPRSI
ncbi:MAG: DUF2061 domain-containing protein [Caulobacteraceae bacterium]